MRKRDVSAKTTFVQSINKGKRLRGEEKVFKKIYIYKNPRILAMIKMKGGWKKDVQVFFTLNIQSRKQPDKTTVIIHTATTLPKGVGGVGRGHSFSTYTANRSKLPFHIFSQHRVK